MSVPFLLPVREFGHEVEIQTKVLLIPPNATMKLRALWILVVCFSALRCKNIKLNSNYQLCHPYVPWSSLKEATLEKSDLLSRYTLLSFASNSRWEV
jgi:hypothetical protein